MVTRERFKVYGNVFDRYTLNNLDRLAARHLFDELKSSVSIGKEANIFTASKGDDLIIVKIYRLVSCNFNKMFEYLKQDPRLTGLNKQRRKVIFAWTKREYRNLLKARDAGIDVPTPLDVLDNILLLEYLGDSDGPALQLKDVDFAELGLEQAQKVYKAVAHSMKKLHKAGLVHGDLSSFNILLHKKRPYFIDFSQATVKKSYQYDELLDRDISNIASFFSKIGVDADADRLRKEITGKDIAGSNP